jgi:hypothetical protein
VSNFFTEALFNKLNVHIQIANERNFIIRERNRNDIARNIISIADI